MPYGPISGAAAAPGIVLGAPLVSVGETRALMIQKLVGMLGGRDDLDKIKLGDWVNEAYIDIATGFDFPETDAMLGISLVSGQPFYNLPEGIDYTKAAVMPDTTGFRGGRSLIKIDLDVYRTLPESSLYGFGFCYNLPDFYFVYGNVLVVYPTPVSAVTLTLDVSIIPQPLVRESDSPILTREWHRGIRLKAKQMILADNKSMQESMLAENEFVKFVQARGNRRALEKTNRLATAYVAGRDCGYDLGQNSGNPFVDRGSDF